MPKRLENRLWRTARKKRMNPRAAKAYVYGAMRESGWTPKKKRKK